jgi:ATP-binding cassette subfamily E protein 1
VRSGVKCIWLEKGYPIISEILCVGCGICIKKCPFKALSIINLADELEEESTHRFGPNSFKLFGLPLPSPGVVLGLLGQNGIGKSTALKIFSGEIMPNLGNYDNPPNHKELIEHFRGSTLQNYFEKRFKEEMTVVLKPQYVNKISNVINGRVREILHNFDERGKKDEIINLLELDAILNRELKVLSGGEIQRVAIAVAICRKADLYLFDESSSYLDAKQRLLCAKAIRSLKKENKMVIVTEHDLAVLDYLSDQICIFYGTPGVYGIVSNVHGVKTGINIYLDGFLPDENLRFRKEQIRFHIKLPSTKITKGTTMIRWKKMEKNYEGFKLKVEPGEAKNGEVIGILGPNGIGKTTFVKILAGIESPDFGKNETKNLIVSYKPQYISTDYKGTVEELLKSMAKEEFESSWYRSQIIHPLNISPLFERKVKELSGGELQKIAIATCLSKKAEVYVLDEPSAYLDVEERLIMTKTIRRIIETRNIVAFVVEHDVVAQDFLADRLIIFTGTPGVYGQAKPPTTIINGMNLFLEGIGITFRREPINKRPRVNKEGSKLDKFQKAQGKYYYV